MVRVRHVLVADSEERKLATIIHVFLYIEQYDVTCSAPVPFHPQGWRDPRCHGTMRSFRVYGNTCIIEMCQVTTPPKSDCVHMPGPCVLSYVSSDGRPQTVEIRALSFKAFRPSSPVLFVMMRVQPVFLLKRMISHTDKDGQVQYTTT